MAVAQLGGTFTAIKGKVAGTIYQGYKGQQIIRTRKSFNKGKQGAMQSQIARQTTIASGWKTIGDLNRAAWNAAAPSFPRYDKFGEPTTLSGYGLYLSVNALLIYYGQPFLVAPVTPVALDLINSIAISALDATHFDVDYDTNTTETSSAVFAFSRPYTQGQSPGVIQFVKSQAINAHGIANISLLSEYIARFGNLIVGSKIFVKIQMFDTATGQMSTPITSSAVVA